MHEGHRDRVYTKFLKEGDDFNEVALTELMLFYTIPHMDVKPIAYELIAKFGTLENLVRAPASALMTVKGIGKRSASFIKLIGEISSRINGYNQRIKVSPSLSLFLEELKEYFKNVNTEKMVCYLLDANGKVVSRNEYTDFNRAEVCLDLTEISEQIVKLKPFAAMIGHNHLSGSVKPSIADDITTKRIATLFNMYHVNFYDHIIVCGDNFYSYHSSGKLDEIKEHVRNSFEK